MCKEIAILIIFAIHLIFLESRNGHNTLRIITRYLDEVLFVKSSIYEKEMSILKFIGNQDP